MSFVWKADKRLKSPEQVAKECLEVARARGLDDFAAVLAVMCVAQESDFWCPANEKDPTSKNYPHDSLSNDGRSVAYFQQQNGRAGDTLPEGDRDNWWGPMAQRMDLKKSCNEFLARLSDNYRDAINNPRMASDPFIANVQNCRADLRGEYAKHWDRAWSLVRAAASGNPPKEQPVAISGDPVWLEDVLREALGDRLVVHEGWEERGTGGVMGTIWGSMIHHTGNDNETVEVIRDGVQQDSGWLPGPLSQCLITRDGKCHLIAVGPCNHAGPGNWKDLTDGNRQAIGFECAWDGDPQRWPDVMVITMRDAAAAVSKHLGKRAADSVCGHGEYAKPQGRKWDPGNMDMNWFRAEVQKDLDGVVFPGEKPSGPVPPTQQPPSGYTVPPNHTELMYDQQNGRWEMLGWRTEIEAVAAIGQALKIEGFDPTKTGFTRGPKPAKKTA